MKASPVALGAPGQWAQVGITALDMGGISSAGKQHRKAPAVPRGVKVLLGLLWMSSDRPRPGWCVTQAGPKELLKLPGKLWIAYLFNNIFNNILFVQNTFQTCFELPWLWMVTRKNVRKERQSKQIPFSDFQLHCPQCCFPHLCTGKNSRFQQFLCAMKRFHPWFDLTTALSAHPQPTSMSNVHLLYNYFCEISDFQGEN